MKNKIGYIALLIIMTPALCHGATKTVYGKGSTKSKFISRSAAQNETQTAPRDLNNKTEVISTTIQTVQVMPSIYPRYLAAETPKSAKELAKEKEQSEEEKTINPLIPMAIGTAAIAGAQVTSNILKKNVMKKDCLAQNGTDIITDDTLYWTIWDKSNGCIDCCKGDTCQKEDGTPKDQPAICKDSNEFRKQMEWFKKKKKD